MLCFHVWCDSVLPLIQIIKWTRWAKHKRTQSQNFPFSWMQQKHENQPQMRTDLYQYPILLKIPLVVCRGWVCILVWSPAQQMLGSLSWHQNVSEDWDLVRIVECTLTGEVSQWKNWPRTLWRSDVKFPPESQFNFAPRKIKFQCQWSWQPGWRA